MHQDQENHILYRSVRILEGAYAGLFLFSIFVLALYFLGNYQEFLDSSQTLLLDLLKRTSLICALTSGYYLIGLIIWMIRRRHLTPFRLLFGIVALGISIFFSLGTNFLLIILAPVNGVPGS